MESIYLFLGEEELIIQNRIDKVILDSGVDSFNITTYDCTEEPLTKAINDCMTPPFLADKKVVIIRHPIFLTKAKSQITHNTQFLEQYLDNPAPFTTLIINAYGEEVQEINPTYKKLLQKASCNTTPKLTRVEAEGWLKRQFNIQGYMIEDSTVKLFFDRMGESLLNAKNEIEKVQIYLGSERTVTDDVVKKVVTYDIEHDVFALSNAIVAKKKQDTVRIYEELVLGGEDPVRLLGLISKSINLLLSTKQILDKGLKINDICRILNVSSGRASHLITDSKRFSLVELEDSVKLLHEIDYKIKSGQVDPSTSIEFLLLELK